MKILHTTLGPKTSDTLGLILPHEHVFVDFRLPEHPHHGEADPTEVQSLMVPELRKVAQQPHQLWCCGAGSSGYH